MEKSIISRSETQANKSQVVVRFEFFGLLAGWMPAKSMRA